MADNKTNEDAVNMVEHDDEDVITFRGIVFQPQFGRNQLSEIYHNLKTHPYIAQLTLTYVRFLEMLGFSTKQIQCVFPPLPGPRASIPGTINTLSKSNENGKKKDFDNVMKEILKKDDPEKVLNSFIDAINASRALAQDVYAVYVKDLLE